MKKFSKYIIPIGLMLLIASPALGALDLDPGRGIVNPNEGIDGTDVADLINTVVNWMMGIGIAICVGMFVYGGIIFGAKDDKSGKDMMKKAAIGMLAILAVGLVVNTIANVVLKKGQVF